VRQYVSAVSTHVRGAAVYAARGAVDALRHIPEILTKWQDSMTVRGFGERVVDDRFRGLKIACSMYSSYVRPVTFSRTRPNDS
jgi:hypothetical protein